MWGVFVFFRAGGISGGDLVKFFISGPGEPARRAIIIAIQVLYILAGFPQRSGPEGVLGETNNLQFKKDLELFLR